MRILLTGAGGFLGRQVLALLFSNGHQLIAVSRTPDMRQASSTAGVEWILDDPGEACRRGQGCDQVIHLATSYGREQTALADLIACNVVLPAQLCEQCARMGIPFLAADTFFSRPGTRYSHLPIYSASKRAFVEIGSAIVGERSLLAVMAIEHLYGPGDDVRKAIPMLVRRIVRQSGRIPLTDGCQQRDFIHVRDAAAAIVRLSSVAAILGKGTLRIEIGSGSPLALRDLLELVHARSRSSTVLGFGDLPQRLGEPEPNGADISLLRSLGWSPQIRIEQGIDEMVAEAL